jgi:hypothetical protein
VNIPSNPEAVKKSFREDTATALMYAQKSTGLRFAEIENMKVRDLLDLLDNKEPQENTNENEATQFKSSKNIELEKKRLSLRRF